MDRRCPICESKMNIFLYYGDKEYWYNEKLSIPCCYCCSLIRLSRTCDFYYMFPIHGDYDLVYQIIFYFDKYKKEFKKIYQMTQKMYENLVKYEILLEDKSLKVMKGV